MRSSTFSMRNLVLASSVLAAVSPAMLAIAAEITPDRLNNADKEPQDWLMNHRTYDGQRSSPLARTNGETGEVVWETTFPEIASVVITTAPVAIKDKIIVGAANSGAGIRDWIAALDAPTGKLVWLKYTVPAPGEPGSETWKDKNNAW